MAKIKGPNVAWIEGRIGVDLLYQTWKGIEYIRKKPIPAYTNTEKQAKNRAKFAKAVAAWQDLTDVEKGLWRALSYGTNMSGYEYFIKKYILDR